MTCVGSREVRARAPVPARLYAAWYLVLYFGCTLDFISRSCACRRHDGQEVDRCSPRAWDPCTNATVFVDRKLSWAELFLARHALRAESQRCRVNQMAVAVKLIAHILADEIDAFKEGRS